MKLKELSVKIELPQGVKATKDNKTIIIEGPKGNLSREFINPKININVENDKIVLKANNVTKRDKKDLYTYEAHIKNMIRGVLEGFNYKLKICYSHFPMNVSIQKNQLIIKNFYGENFPRTVEIPENVNVKINGQIIELTGIDKEKVGNCATKIEQSTRITTRDRRIFQDGIFIIEKAGKLV